MERQSTGIYTKCLILSNINLMQFQLEPYRALLIEKK